MSDPINPKHYKTHPSGVECIDIIEWLPANLAFTVKHIWREGQKGDSVEDLKKAAWYLNREIERREKLAFDAHVNQGGQHES